MQKRNNSERTVTKTGSPCWSREGWRKEALMRGMRPTITLLAFFAAAPLFASQLSVTVTGAEQSSGGVWDAGTLTVRVNEHTETFSYGQFSTNASVASGIAARFSQDCSSALVAKAVGNVITFVEKNPNGADVQLIASVEWNSATFSQSSFNIPTPTTGPPLGTQLAVSLDVLCTPNPVPTGSSMQCSAKLPPHLSVEPTGTVSFQLDGSVWTSANVDNAGLAVATSLPSLATGAHNITASYSGDTNYLATSGAITVSGLSGSGLPSAVVYSYNIAQPNGTTGYAANGNIVAYTDSVNGTWSVGYDDLNRLANSVQTPVGSASSQYGCWSYDSFGNLQQQYMSNQAFTSSAGQSCQPAGAAVTTQTQMNYTDGSNRISSGAWMNKYGLFNQGAPSYDAAGNITNDLQNQYLYTPDGQVCAVQQPSAYGIAGPKIGYLYNASGQRVAKGTLTSMSCDPTINGFQATNVYIIGPDGTEMTEVDGAGNWVHTNVAAAGEMIATYKNDGQSLHFQLADWLGSRRVQTDYLGQTESTCQSQPFGDGMTCTGTTASEHKYTGKERDAESGLDNFGARYYGSNMGRFMSPDPSGLMYADPTNPQSLNLYSYVLNNPLKNTDPTGMYCYYGDPNSTSDGFDHSQYDFHSSSGECTAADENGNKGQWIDDAYTHNGSDDDNRPQEGVSAMSSTSAPSTPPSASDAIMNTINGVQEYNRISLQFDGNWRAHPWRPTDHFTGPMRLSDSFIRNACTTAAIFQGGGSVIPGVTNPNQESLDVNATTYKDTQKSQNFTRDGAFINTSVDTTVVTASSPSRTGVGNAAGAIAGGVGTFASCYAAVSAANAR